MANPQIDPVIPATPVAEASLEEPLAALGQAKPRTLFRRGWDVFAENKLALTGLGFVTFILMFCFVGPHIYVTQQVIVTTSNVDCHPSLGHLLGCDDLGYDVVGRLMAGGQNSLEVGLMAALVACLFGSVYGAVAGYIGGFVDSLMMRVVDAMLSIPFIFVLIVLARLIHPNTFTLTGFIALTYWPSPARLVRAETLSLRTREYVQAVKVVGGTRARAILRHIMPNAIGVIIVQATFAVADSILILSSLGFLGFGIQAPQTDWGTMLSNGLQDINLNYWWLIYPAGVLIIATVTAFNFIGDALRDAFETRLQRR
jgi:peptide/nickel transport system permease protein